MILRVIGGIVVYGFALYGVARFLGRPKVGDVAKSDLVKETPETTGEPSVAQAGGDSAESQVGA